MITKTKTIALLFIGVFFLIGNQTAEAQLLKKLKDAAQGKTESTSNSKGSSKMIGESEVSNDFVVDEYGFNGIYYSQTKNGIIKTNMQFEICKEKSKAKGAEDMPACIVFKHEIPETNSKIWKDSNAADGYGIPQSVVNTKKLFFPSRGMFGDILYIEPGVLFMSAKNYTGIIGGTEPFIKKDDFNIEDYVNSGSFFVKNKEDLKNWSNSVEIQDKVKNRWIETMENINAIYAEVDGKKNANNEMPSIGKLNSKFIQDRALKTYKEKYDPINKGWTHNYMYVHGNEWVNKKKYLPNGQLVESHRELHVVIVRTNPQGQCKADLMYYVEIFENGKYDAANGKVTGPVSYIGMPGGYLPCEKATAFKSKLAK
ncbi:hypothetical protein M0M57_04775 [Flavobacterium azooxidireducens]|uniref:Uncharacterized protein n=1 Tax=Flavobacterium azooxidireducens TaxID=1871076 RepID=A0ABY4KHI4_9FLAO|nr:hypothetical protein [Flavobacterium azooxidireducens]UPQ80149.1 hypothetical protein M0M57_04775 [Flavobacterium azooxidireducens]